MSSTSNALLAPHAGLVVPAPGAATSAPLLIEGGTLIDGTGANPVPNEGVLIVGDEICAVGSVAVAEAAKLESEGGCPQRLPLQRIDARGRWVLPGLIDAHCHVSFLEPASNDELFFHRPSEGLTAILAAHSVKKLLLSGCTGFLDADVLYNVGADLRDSIEIGAVEGPRMSTGGNALLTAVGGTAGRLIPEDGLRGYAQVVRTPDEIVQTVRRQIKHGVDWIKLHITGLIPRQLARGEIAVWSFEEIRLACETAHALHTPVVAHVRNAASTRDAARAGVDLLLHATNMDDEALEAVIDAQVPIAPTLAFQANLAEYGAAAGASPELVEIFRREIEDSSISLRKAYDAGVPIMCGSESGFTITPIGEWHGAGTADALMAHFACSPHSWQQRSLTVHYAFPCCTIAFPALNPRDCQSQSACSFPRTWLPPHLAGREMEVLVKHLGLTPLQAITCATKEGARSLRLDGRVGVISKGQLADVIVVDQDPLQDIRVLNDRHRLTAVISKGQSVNLEVPWPSRALYRGEKVVQWTGTPLTRELAMSIDPGRPIR